MLTNEDGLRILEAWTADADSAYSIVADLVERETAECGIEDACLEGGMPERIEVEVRLCGDTEDTARFECRTKFTEVVGSSCGDMPNRELRFCVIYMDVEKSDGCVSIDRGDGEEDY